MARRRGHHHTLRAVGASVVALLLGLGLLPAPVAAVAPSDGGTPALFPVVINTTGGDQYDPHVSGDLAAYTAGDTIRYYDFLTGTDVEVPPGTGTVDALSGVSNGKIAFARAEPTGRQPIMVFDTATSSTIEIDPQPNAFRSGAAIGSDTVAFIDEDPNHDGGGVQGGELIASTLGGSTVRVTTDLRIDGHPSVAPLGDRIVYESCESSSANCDVREADRTGSSWAVTNLTNTSEPEANPDTDGAVAVYDATRSGERDIYWQPVGGGTEQQLVLRGEQRNPSVSRGIVAFESVALGDTAADLYVYEIATNRLFRITTTPGIDETLSDVYAFPDGRVRVVWSSGPLGQRDVYGATFTLPAVAPSPVFGGFLEPVNARPTLNSLKAGAAVPVKFSLGGDFGLGIFAAGYPKSEVMACDATADVDGIEQTVTSGGSSLTYDPLTGIYTYVWKTDKSWSGTCRQLVLTFADGSIQRANFKLK